MTPSGKAQHREGAERVGTGWGGTNKKWEGAERGVRLGAGGRGGDLDGAVRPRRGGSRVGLSCNKFEIHETSGSDWWCSGDLSTR